MHSVARSEFSHLHPTRQLGSAAKPVPGVPPCVALFLCRVEKRLGVTTAGEGFQGEQVGGAREVFPGRSGQACGISVLFF